jgi:hypothetical protein
VQHARRGAIGLHTIGRIGVQGEDVGTVDLVQKNRMYRHVRPANGCKSLRKTVAIGLHLTWVVPDVHP